MKAIVTPRVTLGCAGRFVRAALAAILACSLPVPLAAQTIEIAPLAGYRFGGDLFEIAANRRLDVDGAPVVGATVNIDMTNGLSFEALFTRQEAQLGVPVPFG